MDFNKVFEDESRRAVDILARDGSATKREIEDKVTIKIPLEVWRQMFNMAEGYVACGPDFKPFTGDVYVRFVRRETREAA